MGYRTIDCAYEYLNEVGVGKAIKRALEEGLCKREDLFIVSKLWNSFHDPKWVELQLRRTLENL